MTSVHLSQEKPSGEARRLPPLENGDRLDQKTFHERYAAMRSDARAELIGGIVYILNAAVSWATESIDLHGKKSDYEKTGVREYLVVAHDAASREQRVNQVIAAFREN